MEAFAFRERYATLNYRKKMLFRTRNSTYLCVTVTGNVHPCLYTTPRKPSGRLHGTALLLFVAPGCAWTQSLVLPPPTPTSLTVHPPLATLAELSLRPPAPFLHPPCVSRKTFRRRPRDNFAAGLLTQSRLDAITPSPARPL